MAGLAFLAVAFSSVAVGAESAGRGRRVLSEEPRIELADSLLVDSDVEALRALAKSLGLDTARQETNATNGGDDFCVLDPRMAAAGAEPGWQAVSRLQASAAKWAGLSVGSATPVVSRWETWSAASDLNRSGILHLDARMRPQSRRTVLAYLSGTGDAEDGLTVFPCVETPDMEAKEAARREKMCSRAFRHLKLAHEKLLSIHGEGMALPPTEQYQFLSAHPELTQLPKALPDGTRPVNWQWTAAHDAVAEQPGALRAEPLWRLAEAMCRGQAGGLRVAPRAGAALLLEVADPDARRGAAPVPEWRAWHAGCSPRAGRGRRWTAQLFLEDAAPAAAEAGGAEGCAAGLRG
ncbi:unnamed protein product [Prorocentrum cordatum]|uniref:Prolyl 4-hydroxylase alpha subunit domain-containing protein n=1 Tax=Prorocentrum cordatum TaxID=2364126 RepID=A0ABN9PW29_9DINO|nr:unnamed protein product [Polarella glacialis]